MSLLDNFNAVQFDATLRMVAQQKGSKLGGTVFFGGGFNGGENVFVPYLDDMEFADVTSRYSDTQWTQMSGFMVRIDKQVKELAKEISKFDTFDMVVDPQGRYMPAMSAALGRKRDQVIIAALGGTAYIGDAASVSSQEITQTVTAGSGLVVDKIQEVSEYFNANELDQDDKFFVVTPAVATQMLGQSEITSSDYNTVKPLVEGKVIYYNGFYFIVSNLLTQPSTATSGTHVCYAYTRNAVELREDIGGNTTIDRLPTRHNNIGLISHYYGGATRHEVKRVVKVNVTATAAVVPS
jgi:hypothetical protein